MCMGFKTGSATHPQCSLELREYLDQQAESLGAAAAALAHLTQLAEVGLSVLMGVGSEEAFDDYRDPTPGDEYCVLSPLAALQQLTSLRLHNIRLPPDMHQLRGMRSLRDNSVHLEPWCDDTVGAISWTLDPWTALSRLTLLELKSALPGGPAPALPEVESR